MRTRDPVLYLARCLCAHLMPDERDWRVIAREVQSLDESAVSISMIRRANCSPLEFSIGMWGSRHGTRGDLFNLFREHGMFEALEILRNRSLSAR